MKGRGSALLLQQEERFKKKNPLQTEKVKAVKRLATSGMGSMNKDFTKYGSAVGMGRAWLRLDIHRNSE